MLGCRLPGRLGSERTPTPGSLEPSASCLLPGPAAAAAPALGTGGGARLPGNVLVDGGASVQEDDDADHGRGDEHLGVDAQPGEVEADLLPEVLPARGANGHPLALAPRPSPSRRRSSLNWGPGFSRAGLGGGALGPGKVGCCCGGQWATPGTVPRPGRHEPGGTRRTS